MTSQPYRERTGWIQSIINNKTIHYKEEIKLGVRWGIGHQRELEGGLIIMKELVSYVPNKTRQLSRANFCLLVLIFHFYCVNIY